MQITPHSGGSAHGGLGAVRGGVASRSDCGTSNGGTSAWSKHWAPRGWYVRSQCTKCTLNCGTSAPNILGTPSGGGSALSKLQL
jgi:hypothetical protein